MHSLMVGLPGSGKTTFLAALWHSLTSGDVPTAIQLKSLAGQSEHLNRIRENWLKAEPVPRTFLADQQMPEMTLQDKSTAFEELVIIPDLSGEVFRDAINNRHWPEEIDNLVNTSFGIVFFLHSNEIHPHVPIDEAYSVLEGELPTISAVPSPPLLWNPEMVPTQVMLLDLLQLISSRRGTEQLQLAIVASAWDLVEDLGMSPREWVQRELPIFYQFLKNNTQTLNWEIYGVSAQGGQFPKDSKKLRQASKPTHRIKVVGPTGESHDITEPIHWAMRGEPSTP